MTAPNRQRVADALYRRQIVLAAVVAAVGLAVLLAVVSVIAQAEGTALSSPVADLRTPTGRPVRVPVQDHAGLSWTAVAALVALGGALVLAVSHLASVLRFVLAKKEP